MRQKAHGLVHIAHPSAEESPKTPPAPARIDQTEMTPSEPLAQDPPEPPPYEPSPLGSPPRGPSPFGPGLWSYPPREGQAPALEPSSATERRPPGQTLRRRLAPIGAAILALAAKLKAILLFLPKVKLLVTAGSMAVSIAAYASIWGLAFAVGFVVLLLVHEMGHVIALRREGIAATPPMFIPFLGALISARSLGDNALAEARVGLAGPILGSLGAGACLVIWQITGHDYWRALGYTGLFLNLFNLLPVVPLDGGRAMAAMSPWMWFAGFAGIVALAILFPNPIILIIAVLAGFETYRRWQRIRARRHGSAAGPGQPGQPGVDSGDYYRVAPRDRILVAAVYLGLIGALVVGMSAAHLPRTLG
jgi:Zn-dependent protease